jgi:uncharacterized DUF497 family protein
MRFEWDDAKAASNLVKHAVPFAYATRVLLDARRVTEQSPQPSSEIRYVTLGMVEGRLLVIVYTKRGRVIRLISARKGNVREQKKYHQFKA